MFNNYVIDCAAHFIAHFEGFRSYPYKDSDGKWTIGYGTTKIKGASVNQDTPNIDEYRGIQLLVDHIRLDVPILNGMLSLQLNDNQQIAILDFVYNLGLQNFSISNLYNNLKINPNSVTKENFTSWNKQKLPGLTIRRLKEWEQYTKL